MATPTLILIPGLMCDGALYQEQRIALGALAPQIHVADHGMADSIAAMAAGALALAAGPVALVGRSMGGRVALEVLRQAPERVSGIALLDTGSRRLASGEAGAREVEGRLRLLDHARREGVAAMAATWVQGMVHPDHLRDRRLLQSIIEMFARRTADHFAAQVQALINRPDATGLLAGIACPALVLTGDQDVWSPPSAHREMADQIPGSEVVVVAQSGHMSPMEQPATVSAALRAWFRRCS